MDIDDLNLLESLDKLSAIIARYNPENIYNMDETGLFFRLLPRYILLMPFDPRMLGVQEVRKNLKNECRLFGQMEQELTKFHAHLSKN